MDDQPEQEKEQNEINKIDLSALQGFSFGTQWTPAEKAVSPRREGKEREHQGDRGHAGGGHAPRDRRQLHRPTGNPQRGAPAQGRPEQARGAQDPRDRGSNFRDRRDRSAGQQNRQQDNRPYMSQLFDVVFYPEDEIFHKIVQRVRDSKHTYELFEIARAVLGKNERCVIVVRRKPDASGNQPPVHVSVVDGLPFETEEEAVNHAVRTHLGNFFTIEDVELEAPKGSFVVVSRCGITGELLGPPNHHRYQHILQQHHAARLPQMSFERFRERLESVREPEAINAWLEKMKKGVRYTWKMPAEGVEAPVFDAHEDARNHLLANARDQVVRQLEHARFQGKLLESIPDGEIRRAIEGQLERQRRFPLESANALRGRLRREGFTIFKKGAKGVSYVCAVKRKFRNPGQTFSDSIGNLIQFIETNPMISVRELPAKMLGFTLPPRVLPVSPGGTPAEPKALSPEGDSVVRRLLLDLRWLVSEGYVTEFSDGKLYAPPPATPQSKKEVEHEEEEHHDEEVTDETSEGHPEAQAEVHQEVQPGVQPEAQPDSAPEAPAPTAETTEQTEPVADTPVDPAPIHGEEPIEPRAPD